MASAAGEREVTRTGSETSATRSQKESSRLGVFTFMEIARAPLSLRDGITRISHESSALLVARGQPAQRAIDQLPLRNGTFFSDKKHLSCLVNVSVL